MLFSRALYVHTPAIKTPQGAKASEQGSEGQTAYEFDLHKERDVWVSTRSDEMLWNRGRFSNSVFLDVHRKRKKHCRFVNSVLRRPRHARKAIETTGGRLRRDAADGFS